MTIDNSAIEKLKNKLRKPHVNSTCIWCSLCVAVSGNVFELDDQGFSRVKHCDSYEGHDVDDSITACPVNAISWQEADEHGNYLNGVVEHMDVV